MVAGAPVASVLVAVPDQPVERTHAPAGRSLRSKLAILGDIGDAGDIEVDPRRLVLDETLEELRGSDRSGRAAADTGDVGNPALDQLVIGGPQLQAPGALALGSGSGEEGRRERVVI